MLTRRDWLQWSALALGAAAAPLRAQGRPLKMLLNSGYSGANAFFLVAEDKGYFKDAGIEVAFTPGQGAYTAAERMMKEGFDIGYGDVSALIETVSREPRQSPVTKWPVIHGCSTSSGAGNSACVLMIATGSSLPL